MKKALLRFLTVLLALAALSLIGIFLFRHFVSNRIMDKGGMENPDTGAAGRKPSESTSQQAEPPSAMQEAATQPKPESCVHAQWAEDVFTDLSDYERFIHGMDEALPLIYFSAEHPVENFRELSLTFESVDDDGNVRFTAEETYNHGTITPETPLLVRMELIGTIPNNGISYVDCSGNTRYFALNASGLDGSLLLTEFTPAEK